MHFRLKFKILNIFKRSNKSKIENDVKNFKFSKETSNIISRQVRPLRSSIALSIPSTPLLLSPFIVLLTMLSYILFLASSSYHPAFHPLLNFSNGLSIVARIRGRIREFFSSVNRTLRHLLSRST